MKWRTRWICQRKGMQFYWLSLASVKKMTIYIFNIRATVMPVRYCLGILEFSNKKSFDQLITTVHPE
jgi:hypothetical protein